MEPIVLYIAQAAELLGLTEEQLYELTRRRACVRSSSPIPHFRIGRRLAFRRSSLEAWINQLETQRP